jgi:type I restriction enzyme M protein
MTLWRSPAILLAMPPTTSTTGTTSQARLSAIIKTARNIMRKDAGLNSDLDRLPQLSWLLFLRAFDAKEEARRIVEGDDFRPAMGARYEWHAWADDERLTGDALLAFVNGGVDADGRKDLLAYLASLKSDIPGDPRNVLGQVFGGIQNKMQSGYLLRELVDQVRKIDFTSSDDIHTMAHLYETLLKEVRDAGGDSGEYYTPRPVIRFMVEQSFPRVGESILDPACGTGGFLIEALTELSRGKNMGISRERELWGEAPWHREEVGPVPVVHDEPDPARRARPADHP